MKVPNKFVWTRNRKESSRRSSYRPGALGRPRGIGWRGRWEGGSGWGTHVNPWLIHFNVWQNPLQLKKKKDRAIHWLEPNSHVFNVCESKKKILYYFITWACFFFVNLLAIELTLAFLFVPCSRVCAKVTLQVDYTFKATSLLGGYFVLFWD